MEPGVFRYRSRSLGPQDIDFIQSTISRFYAKGRSHIARALCEVWGWVQPNGHFKEYAARDLLLRLEEKGLVELPPRLRPKNNLKRNAFAQIPLFCNTPLEDPLSQYGELSLDLVTSSTSYLWDYLVHHHHCLGRPRLVGEHLRYLAFLNGQLVACLGWASAAFKVEDRDRFIGWDVPTRHKHLCFIANNVRFLILPWVRIKHLASKVLSLNLRRLSQDRQTVYGHPLYLAETFVDLSRFKGICYQASNWINVGVTKGSAKRGNRYHHHGQPKAIYLYPLHRNFRRKLADDPG
ncbi:MAG: Druantia anti-phage system protein DruA [Desulfobaccales bacterium]